MARDAHDRVRDRLHLRRAARAAAPQPATAIRVGPGRRADRAADGRAAPDADADRLHGRQGPAHPGLLPPRDGQRVRDVRDRRVAGAPGPAPRARRVLDCGRGADRRVLRRVPGGAAIGRRLGRGRARAAAVLRHRVRAAGDRDAPVRAARARSAVADPALLRDVRAGARGVARRADDARRRLLRHPAIRDAARAGGHVPEPGQHRRAGARRLHLRPHGHLRRRLHLLRRDCGDRRRVGDARAPPDVERHRGRDGGSASCAGRTRRGGRTCRGGHGSSRHDAARLARAVCARRRAGTDPRPRSRWCARPPPLCPTLDGAPATSAATGQARLTHAGMSDSGG